MSQIAMLAGLGKIKNISAEQDKRMSITTTWTPEELKNAWLRAVNSGNGIDAKTGFSAGELSLLLKVRKIAMPSMAEILLDKGLSVFGQGSAGTPAPSNTPNPPIPSLDAGTPAATAGTGVPAWLPLAGLVGVAAVAGVVIWKKRQRPSMAGLGRLRRRW